MTHNLLRQATVSIEPKPNKYQRFGFTQNPFPTKPSVTIDSQDPKENGSIYLPELRQTEQLEFERLLIPHPDHPQTRPIAFLMDYATRRGRGIGKTSFLYHQMKRVMKDLGDELSDGSEVIFAVYVFPRPDEVRKFWHFCRIVMQNMAERGIIATAMWRLRALSGVIPDEVLAEIGTEYQETIGSDAWLQSKKVDVIFKLAAAIRRQLQSLGISHELAENLTNHGHSPIKFQQNYLDKLSDYDWKKNVDRLLFDDLVKLFMAAGFTRGQILVDEVEKIITPQNTQERRAFVDSLRYFFIDGQCENARFSFYKLLLTIHPYAQELLNPHWAASGLDRFATLSGDRASEYTVYFEPLNQDSAIPLARAYLDEARILDTQKGTLTPFEPEALEEALVLSQRVPGIFLVLLNLAVERAIQADWQTIGSDQIKIVAQARAPKEPDESDIIQTLPPTQVDLRGQE